MKGVYGGENKSKLNERLSEVRSRLFENQGTISFFIIHFSFFILHSSLYRLKIKATYSTQTNTPPFRAGRQLAYDDDRPCYTPSQQKADLPGPLSQIQVTKYGTD
jgi:hypothetical protein